MDKFCKSVSMYGGFYIARYEAGRENDKLFSKINITAWNNVNRDEAINLSNNMYEKNDEFETSLVNSFAWDTMLKWIDTTNNTSFSSKVFTEKNEESTYITGKNQINNIYDLSGNVWEWTTENCDKTAVLRAGELYSEELDSMYLNAGNRNLISSKAKYQVIGFRVILFKNI